MINIGGKNGISFLSTSLNESSIGVNNSESSTTLNGLTLSANSFNSNATAGTVIGAIQNKTVGSTVTVNPSDGRVSISGNNLVVGATPSTAGTFNITLRETLAGATNTPRDTILSLTVNAVVTKLPVHSRVAALGDGIISGQNSAVGPASGIFHALEYINGALRPCIGFDAGAASGETFASMRARVPQIIAAKPDIVIVHGSHNDLNNTYTHTTNSAWNSTWTDVAGYNTKLNNIINDLKTGLPNAKIVIITTVPSLQSDGNYFANETPANRDAIWNFQRGLAGGNVYVCDLGGTGTSPEFNVNTMTHDKTHPNNLGGAFIGRSKLGPLLATLVDTATTDSLLNTRTAFGEFGADLYSLSEYQHAYTTGGTMAGGSVAPTGQYADGKRITNSLIQGTGLAVTCSRDTSNAGYAIQDVTITGTPAAINNIVEDEATSPSSTVTLGVSNAVIGKYYELIVHRVMDDGAGSAPDVRAYAATVGSFGSWNVATTSTQSASSDYGFAFDAVIRTAPKSVSQTNPALINGNLGVNPGITTRLSNVAQQTRLRKDRQILREVEKVAYSTPALIENYVTGANDKMRIIGTIGGTNALIAGPGQWAGGNLTFSPKWYLNGVEVASSWVYTQATPASGDVIMFKPNPSNSFGSDTTTSVSVTV